MSSNWHIIDLSCADGNLTFVYRFCESKLDISMGFFSYSLNYPVKNRCLKWDNSMMHSIVSNTTADELVRKSHKTEPCTFWKTPKDE